VKRSRPTPPEERQGHLSSKTRIVNPR
jgi:hypothetical protein